MNDKSEKEPDLSDRQKNSSNSKSKSTLNAYQSYNSIQEKSELPDTKNKHVAKKQSYSTLPNQKKQPPLKIN